MRKYLITRVTAEKHRNETVIETLTILNGSSKLWQRHNYAPAISN